MSYDRPIDRLPLPGTPDFHKARARFRKKQRKQAQITLEDIKTAYDKLARHKDCAFKETKNHDAMVGIVRRIRNGTYRPEKPRKRKLPKPGGGYRTLQIPSQLDRAVSRACLDSISSQAEMQFDPRSHGARRDFGIQSAISMASEALAAGLSYFASADVQTAFDTVPIEKALNCLTWLAPGHHNLELIRVIARGHLGASSMAGLRQGDCLSPLLFNAFMHFHADQAIQNTKDFAYVRFTDNIFTFSREPGLGPKMLGPVKENLAGLGMNLRMDPEVYVNKHQKCQVLGYQLGFENGRIIVTGSEKSWIQLAIRLASAFEKPNPQQAGLSCVKGWFASQSLRDSWSPEDLTRLNDIIKEHGLDFRISEKEIEVLTVTI